MAWKTERHKTDKQEVAFWRNRDNYGYVSIYKAEKGSPYYNEGKFYSIEISTREHLKTDYSKTKYEALKFAKSWMRKHPRG